MLDNTAIEEWNSPVNNMLQTEYRKKRKKTKKKLTR